MFRRRECKSPFVAVAWPLQGAWRGGPEIFCLIFSQNICLVTLILLNMNQPIDKYLWNFDNVQYIWKLCKLFLSRTEEKFMI